MANFNVPNRQDVSAPNQEIFDTLKKGLGMVPNLYAVMALSDTALGNWGWTLKQSSALHIQALVSATCKSRDNNHCFPDQNLLHPYSFIKFKISLKFIRLRYKV